MGQGRSVSRGWAEGWLKRSAHRSLCGVACRGACTVPYICFQHSIFAPGSSDMAVGFFFLFCLFGLEFAPTVHAHSYFSSHIVSVCFVAQGELCPGASIAVLLRSVPGPRPVSLWPQCAVVS